jgi:RNA 3'-terminal phosphate cyclase (ATP)
MGPTVTIDLKKCGFYPAGGGHLDVTIKPAHQLRRIDILERGQIKGKKITAILGSLPDSIGQREVRLAEKKFEGSECEISVKQVSSFGPGNALFIEIICEHITELITSLGKRGFPAEAVAHEAVKEAKRYLAAGAPVGPYLADQILIPMALANGGSFITCEPTQHTRTNVEVIKHFLDITIGMQQIDTQLWRIDVGGR